MVLVFLTSILIQYLVVPRFHVLVYVPAASSRVFVIVVGSISFVAFGSIRTQLCAPSTSVSTLILNPAEGFMALDSANFKAFHVTPVPISGKLIFVLLAEFHTAHSLLALANVGAVSLKVNEFSRFIIGSHRG
jgi:hypothetical protein